MEKDVDVQALSAAIAGFLACHILTCRFLVQEGLVDQDRFSSYLETAMAEMAPPPDDAGDGPELAPDDGRSGFDDDGRPADAEDDH